MRKLVPVLLVLFGAVPAIAQTVRITAWPDGVASLNQGWKTHAGDNAAWSAPTFDDSSWEPIARLNDPVAGARLATPGLRWYRIHLHLEDASGPLALGIRSPQGSTDVWINGRPVDSLPRRGAWSSVWGYPHVIPLPQGVRDLTIAVRTNYLAYQAAVTERPCFFDAEIGTPRIVAAWAESVLNARRLGFLPLLLVDLGLVLTGLGMLLLHRMDRSEPSFLWLGIYLVALGLVEIAFGIAYFSLGPALANGAIGDPCSNLILALLVEFVFRFVRRRKSLFWRSYQWACLAIVPVALTINILGRAQATYVLVGACWLLPVILFLPAELIRWFLQGSREAGLLVLPIGLNAIFNFLFVGGYFASVYLHLAAFDWTAAPLTIAGFPVLLQVIGDALFLLSIGAVMALRFQRVSRAQARASAEFEAARQMQRRMVPETLPPIPSCKLDACYEPANEVGGDFYQVVPLPCGGTLLVVGDVSGKGLKAAMTGALALGALRSLAQEHRSPAEILTRLNAQLAAASDGGFVTCLCARMDPDGGFTFANAGHLPPYRNGEELSVGFGLPLGIAPEATYPETTIRLAPEDRLTLLTDGVVEAKSSSGELFGFDRTAAISTQSAESIAQAAQQFGQEDDITVLTLNFAPAEVLHA